MYYVPCCYKTLFAGLICPIPNLPFLCVINNFFFSSIQIFGAVEEEQAIGFPVAGKSAAANVRHIICDLLCNLLTLVAFCNVVKIDSYLLKVREMFQ